MTRWTVYMVRCADGSLYTGITTDLHRRLRQHNGTEKGGAKYTRSRRPVTLVFTRAYYGTGAVICAKKLECAIKALPKAEKEKYACDKKRPRCVRVASPPPGAAS